MGYNARIDRVPGVVTDTAVPLFRRDRLLQADGYSAASPSAGGVLHLIDLANGGYSWPSMADPTNGAVIKDLTEKAADASYVITGTGSEAFAGNGFDYSGVVNPGRTIDLPASVAASIWGGGTLAQYFSQLLYVRLPTLAQFPTSAQYTRPLPFSTFVTAAQGFTAEADLLSLAMVNNGSLRAIRPTNGIAAFDTIDIVPVAADYGSVVQLLFWRNAGGQGFRLKSANGVVLATRAVGTDNPTDVSAKKCHIGVGTAVWSNATTQGKPWRFYRNAFENLRVSGRDPVAVADADWGRVTGLRGNPFS